MPIRPENAKLYPPRKVWLAIVAEIRERSGNCCEGSPAFPDCRIPNGWFRNNTTGEVTHDAMQFETWTLLDGDSASMIVLTTAHIDHNPGNNGEPGNRPNLRHLCQKCHLTHDAKLHAANSYQTRHKRKAIRELFDA